MVAKTTDHGTVGWEAGLALKFGAVGMIGFLVDAALLRAGIGLGLSPAAARAVSLIFAMQTTFAINGAHVFRCLTRRRIVGQWAGYMAANGFGNLCNYWIFLTLISLHREVVSNYYVALCVSSLTAWAINYAGTRLLVFGAGRASLVIALRRRRMKETCALATAARQAQPPPPTA